MEATGCAAQSMVVDRQHQRRTGNLQARRLVHRGVHACARDAGVLPQGRRRELAEGAAGVAAVDVEVAEDDGPQAGVRGGVVPDDALSHELCVAVRVYGLRRRLLRDGQHPGVAVRGTRARVDELHHIRDSTSATGSATRTPSGRRGVSWRTQRPGATPCWPCICAACVSEHRCTRHFWRCCSGSLRLCSQVAPGLLAARTRCRHARHSPSTAVCHRRSPEPGSIQAALVGGQTGSSQVLACVGDA